MIQGTQQRDGLRSHEARRTKRVRNRASPIRAGYQRAGISTVRRECDRNVTLGCGEREAPEEEGERQGERQGGAVLRQAGRFFRAPARASRISNISIPASSAALKIT